MAKKKTKNKNNSQQNLSVSPEKFIREKARTLPIGKCYITPGWKENGISQIIVTRVRPSGNLVVGLFLTDTFCLGVKDVVYYHNMPDYEFEKLLNNLRNKLGIEEISYNEAHNLIFGAIGWAEDGGIAPHKNFSTGQYILEEDTEDVPLIEYEFGKNGKHYLVVSSRPQEKRYINTLKKNLGDNFDYTVPIGDGYDEFGQYDDDDDEYDDDYDDEDLALTDAMKDFMAESQRHPEEVYSYKYPAYPASLTVKHQFLVSELFDSKNFDSLPDETIDRILKLPSDEVAEDLSHILLYEIGETYPAINDGTIDDIVNSPIMHALLLLTQTRSERGLDAVLEVMRQNEDFADYHLGDFASEILPSALYACGNRNIKAIESYIYEPGLQSYMRSFAIEALVMTAINHPERREEIIELFRRLLSSLVTRLPKQNACDGLFAGFLMANLIDVNATELIPEIKAVFATDCVDKTIAGDCDEVVKEIKFGKKESDKYAFPDIHKQYVRIKSCGNN